jgi:desulfoferrodoxin (superoxide reductase-like protein)
MIDVQPSDGSHHITWIAMRKAVEVIPEEELRNDDGNDKTLNVKCMCQRRSDRGVQERGGVESEA